MSGVRDAADQDPDGEHGELHLPRVSDSRASNDAWLEADSALLWLAEMTMDSVNRGPVVANAKCNHRAKQRPNGLVSRRTGVFAQDR